MKRLIVTLAAGSMFAGPLAAQDQDTPAGAEQPQMCEMMHNGERMQGMMMRGENGMMTCQMMEHGEMDHAAMDHGKMDHSQMSHDHMNHGQHAEPGAIESEAEAPQGEPAEQDHSAHEGHTPG